MLSTQGSVDYVNEETTRLYSYYSSKVFVSPKNFVTFSDWKTRLFRDRFLLRKMSPFKVFSHFAFFRGRGRFLCWKQYYLPRANDFLMFVSNLFKGTYLKNNTAIRFSCPLSLVFTRT